MNFLKNLILFCLFMALSGYLIWLLFTDFFTGLWFSAAYIFTMTVLFELSKPKKGATNESDYFP